MNDFQRSQWADVRFGVIGRALAVAARFERGVIALASLVGLGAKPDLLASRDELGRFILRLHKTPLIAHIRALGINDPEFSAMLDSAREARNEIAHELALGLDRSLDSVPEEYLSATIDRARHLCRTIAEADALISFVLSTVSDEPAPNADFLHSYPDLVADWVAEL